MDDLTNALMIVLSINVMLWLGQVAVLEINPSGTQFSSCNGTLLASFDAYNCTGPSQVLDEASITSDLPKASAGSGGVAAGIGAFFTDLWATLTNWIGDTLGLKYVWSILTAPTNFLKVIGVPPEIAFGLGALWYGVTFFLLIAWLRGV